MPLDPNIALSYKPVGLDIAGAMQAADERKLMQSRNALAASQMANEQDELNNALAARRYAGGADLNDPQNAMRLFGYGKAGADMFQSLQAGRASSAAARKSQLEASGVKAGQYRQALAFVDSPNAAMEWLQAHHDDPDMQDSPVARMPLDVALSRIPQDPVGFQQWKQQAALGIDKYIERNTLTANEQSMETDRAAGRRTSEGQLRVAERNAAVNEAAERRQAGGAGGTKPKDVTVSEQQAAYHGKRILDAAAQVAAATKKTPSANRPSALESAVQATPGVRGFVGGVRSAPRQIVTAAQREMLDALLYLATGAAYNKEQLEGEIESTLPAYLDKPETVRAKRDRLRLKIDAAKIRAGDAWTPEMDAALAVLDADAGSPSATPAASSAPAGVDPALWNVMTPEERSAWQK
jgi:hypothetical protein